MARWVSFIVAIVLSFCAASANAQSKALAEDLASKDDRGFIVGLLEDALGGEGRIVRVDGFQGALSKTATIQRMTIADDEGVWFTLDDVRLRWTRSALLRGQIDVQELSAATLTLARTPIPSENALPSSEATGFSLPNLPVSVSIALMRIDRISLGRPILGEAAEMTLEARADLANGSGSTSLRATRTDGKQGSFVIDASYDAESQMAAIDVDLTEASGGIAARMLNLPRRPDLELTISGAGNINDLVTTLSLKTEGIQRLDGQVALQGNTDAGRAFSLDFTGDLTALLSPEYHAFFGESSVLRARGAQTLDGSIDLSGLTLKTNALSLQGSAALDRDNAPVRLALDGQIAPQSGGSVILPVGGGDVSISRAELGINYDAAISDAIEVALNITNLETPVVFLSDVQTTVTGSLEAALSIETALRADVIFQAMGVQFVDAGQQEAFGDQINGAMVLAYKEAEPLEINNISFEGEDYALTGALSVKGVDDAFETELDVALAATRLARFSKLIGRDLSGQAKLAIAGNADIGGAFDLTLDGTTTDLALGIEQADKALVGVTDLNLVVIRDDKGTQLPKMEIKNGQVQAQAKATLRTDASKAQFNVTLADSSQIDPRLQGAVSLVGTATQDMDGWNVDTKLDGPFGATTTVVGPVTGESPTFRFDLKIPDIQPFARQFRGAAAIAGTARRTGDVWSVTTDLVGPYGISGALSGEITGPAPTASYQLRIPNVASLGAQIDGALSLDGTAEQIGTGWQVGTSMSGLSGTRAQVSGRILQGGTLDMTARGVVPTALANPFIAPRNIQGIAEFDLALKGPPTLNSLSGTISTTNARLSAPTLRNSLSGLDANISLARGRAQIDATAEVSSGGRVTVRGPVVLIGARSADLAISLRDVRVIDPALYETRVDGELSLLGPLSGGAIIAGTINVGETNVRVPESQVAGFTIIPTIAHRNPSAGVRKTLERAGLNSNAGSTASSAGGVSFGLDIRIAAPSKIFVRGRGLDAELGGNLRISGRTDQIISTGRFSLIRGRVDILTKRFVLDEGTIALQGNFDPFLRFVASTRTTSGTASIIIEGPASDPTVRFSSVPDAPEDEVLAQIFFGRDVSKLSAFQALQLASAVATLAGTGGEGIVSKLRRGFGLDDLDIATDDQGNTGLRLGKYISDNVYTDVTVGTNNTAGVSINIDLTPSITARGQVNTNGNSSVGIYFEKDY